LLLYSKLETCRFYTLNIQDLNEITQLPGNVNKNVSEMSADVAIILLVFFDNGCHWAWLSNSSQSAILVKSSSMKRKFWQIVLCG